MNSKRDSVITIAGWILLLIVNVVLLNLRRELAVPWLDTGTGGTPTRGDLHNWQILNLTAGVLVFPGLMVVSLWYVFREKKLKEWRFSGLLLFHLGLLCVCANLLLAQSWMLDHTGVLRDGISVALNAGIPSLYTLGIPILIVLVTIVWTRVHEDTPREHG